MATPKEEKLLASIDGTLKDILKELKKQNRTHVIIDGGTFTEKDLEELKKTKVMPL
ncbi:hypothetical protein [Planococcus sp. ANT_H30]|uniref:hypothetical protein n=1 Tax=Planococcus sp. ANT_H30 TaxID=2597347 RepID=UPI00165E8EC9|nr:hypothetical protein [Planococcus sp. ANT_H30]